MRPSAYISVTSQDAAEEQGRRAEAIEMQRLDDGTGSDILQPKTETRKAGLKEIWSSSPWKVTSVTLAAILALAIIVILAAAAEMASQSYIMGRDCYPNGLWKEKPGATWRIMDSSYFFTPNLSFGAFTFTQVKVIDVAWDVIVGRGGQLLLGWINYRVFNEWLVYHMEMHFTSYKLYAAVAFETTTMGTLGVLAREFLAFGKRTRRRFFRWLAMLSMLLSTLYVLSFPTLMAAMTGYITTYELYVENIESNLIEWGKINRVMHIIEDADRLDYEKPLIITEADRPLTNAVNLYVDGFTYSEFYIDEPSIWVAEETRKSVDLPSPSLKIKSFKTYPEKIIPPPDWFGQVPVAFEIPATDIYSTSYLLEHGSCQPSETYQWGFSYIFLFMVSIFNFIWTCIMIGMWLDTRMSSRMYKSGRRPGLLRSIMDYSAAIRQELGTEAEYLEETDLRKHLKQSGGALIVPSGELRISRADTGEREMKERGWRRRLTKGSTF
ncbi:hypothetical protein COCMIDRAFT_33686 [Bipolaris oryzae ATCC 44560]|uniref:Uncharacterized protein n=1 Tax=Bipolaris oryzae ATCC 44560 TaxID=930090 RepID=W6ZMR5_COCMI|nr:uncharacterized protein COCMIDRAFT_33686 [Bipolaris oryzae ATCC 44560]EUC48819.1 hypothetical protein COCMIDRAFT_33686 [Bipolaris oryzae ATCC 44560]